MGKLQKTLLAALLTFAAVACCMGCLLMGQAMGAADARAELRIEQALEKEWKPEVSDTLADEPQDAAWGFDAAKDLQNPELPTGCEATALSTMLRMAGVEVSKEDVADAMPKSDGEDFVNAFWGDPYSVHGWACMSPCLVETAKRFIPVEKTVVDLSGTPLTYLPTPCVVWVTMGLSEPLPSEYEQDGHGILWNTHCVVLTAAGEATVECIDPLEGVQTYPFSKFNAAYLANGSQAVYIADRGYEPLD